MACVHCENVARGGPTLDQQYVDAFGLDPLPSSYFCEHCKQWWKRVHGNHWMEDEDSSSRVGDDNLGEKLLGAHSHSGAKTQLEIVMNGKKSFITGTAESITPLDGTEIIELLSADATPQFQELDESTPEKFLNAVRLLIEQQQPFRTVLREGWAVPAVLWSSSR